MKTTGFHTPITDLLDREGISYRLLPHAEPVFTVNAAAAQRGVLKAEMVKSILLREKTGSRRYVIACVLGHNQLDPVAVRAVLSGDWRRLTFARGEEITAVTGFIQGAVAPLCLPADLPLIFDNGILACRRVNISTGDAMAGLELDPMDLYILSGARQAAIARSAPEKER